MKLGAVLDAGGYGGKAANLSMALRAGLPVPDGVALSWEAVEVIACGVPGEDQALPADLRGLANTPLAVRSSAVDEDSQGVSFAGQHLTALNVIGHEAVLAAIQRVWRSGRDEAALAYRRRMGMAGNPRIGVVIQRLVSADVAGVLFTRDPVSGDPDRWVTEAAWGLGEAVVAGLVSPDRYITSPSGVVLESRHGTKKVAVVPDAGGGTRQRAVDDEHWCLQMPDIRAVAGLGAACERLFGPGQDIEWAFSEGTLWLLQSRPITT